MFTYPTIRATLDQTSSSQFSGRLWHYRNDGRPTPWHTHPELEFNFVTAGSAVYVVGKRLIEISPGSLLWHLPNHFHGMTKKSVDLEMWIGSFRPEVVGQYCRSESARSMWENNPIAFHCKWIFPAQSLKLTRCFEEVASASGNPDRYNAGLIYALTTAIETQLEAQEIPSGMNLHPALQQAMYLLCRNDDNSSVADIASQSGLSASRISALFKEQIGTTVVEFRNRRRIERFLRLYEDNCGGGMLRAALDAGFGSYLQFFRVFRKNMGCTPAAYKRSLRTNPVRSSDALK